MPNDGLFTHRHLVAPFPNECGGTDAYFVASSGVLQTRRFNGDRPGEPSRFVPAFFGASNGRSSVRFSDSDFMLRLSSDAAELVLTATGYSISKQTGRKRDLTPHTKASGRDIGQALTENPELRRAVLELNTGVWVALHEYAARTQTGLPAPLMAAVAGIGAEIATYTTAPPVLVCETKEIVTEITKDVWELVTNVKSAAEQLLECVSGCDTKRGLDWLLCNAGCYAQGFIDLVSSVMTFIGTVTERLVTQDTHCTWVPGTIPTPIGTLSPIEFGGVGIVPRQPPSTPRSDVDLAAILKVLEQFKPILNCFAKSDWSVTKLKLDDIGIRGAAPVGVKVCFSPECSESLAVAIAAGTLKSLAEIAGVLIAWAGTATLVEAILGIGTIAEVAAVVAAQLGITLEAAAVVVFGFILMCAYQGLWIWGQLLILGARPNGVCFEHPLIMGLLIGPLAVNIPVIVTKR